MDFYHLNFGERQYFAQINFEARYKFYVFGYPTRRF